MHNLFANRPNQAAAPGALWSNHALREPLNRDRAGNSMVWDGDDALPQRRAGRRVSRIALVVWTHLLLLHQSAWSDANGRLAADQAFEAELQGIAVYCDQHGLADKARLVRDWIIPRDPGRHYFFLPTVVSEDLPRDDSTPSPGRHTARFQWRQKFQRARDTQANRLWQHAQQLATQGAYAEAYALLFEIVHESPGHPEARKQLGASALGGFSTPKSRTGRVRHREFRWPAREYRTIDTPHFRILTSAAESEGVALARQLETLHCVWRQLFVEYWANAEQLERSWRTGHPLPKPRRRHQVVLFRNQREYVAHLQKWEPQIAKSLGVYRDVRRTAYFYLGDANLQATWAHEATHQLFHETVSAVRNVASDADFWMVEAVALYMESLSRHEDFCTVGGVDANRLQFARYRALSEDFYVPLAVLSQKGRVAIQQDPEIRRIYSQAAGLMHFFMDGQEGRHRSQIVRHLRDLYTAPGRSQGLEERVSASFATLDKEYHDSLFVTDDQLLAVPDFSRPRRLTLGHTKVTDIGLDLLATCDRLEWLELSACNISDSGIAKLHDRAPLRQLALPATRITDASLRKIGRYGELTELDLSATRITDEGLSHLVKLTNLERLWLTNTNISNQGLGHLQHLKQLRELDLAGTNVSAKAWAQLKRQLPRLD